MIRLTGEHLLMRIFVGEGERFQHRSLYEAIVEYLRGEGVAGATVLHGVAGFGGDGVCHTARLLDLSAGLPLVIEVVDSREKIEAVIPRVEEMMSGGMITQEKVTVLRYQPKEQR